MKRTLHLKREQLADLTTTELTDVAGGALPTGLNFTCPVAACTNDIPSNIPTCFCCTGTVSC